MARDVSKHARYDPAFATDGLFVPTAKKGTALYDVGRDYDDGEIRFEGVQLTAAHQSVLLAVCARTGRDGLLVRGTKDDPLGDDCLGRSVVSLDDAPVARSLKGTGSAKEQNTTIVECSAYSLLIDAGMDTGGKSYQQVVRLLTQLSTVTVYRRVGKAGASSHLLSFDHVDDRMVIALNWRLAASILGEQNVRISLSERHQLGGSVARVLHAWLSCHVRSGGSLMAGQGARLDTLVRHVYDKRPVSDAVQRKRRQQVRAAVSEINQLAGWAAAVDGRGIVRFSRPTIIEMTTPGEDAESTKRAQRGIDEMIEEMTRE